MQKLQKPSNQQQPILNKNKQNNQPNPCKDRQTQNTHYTVNGQKTPDQKSASIPLLMIQILKSNLLNKSKLHLNSRGQHYLHQGL